MSGAGSGSGRAEVAEVEAFLKAHPDIEAAEALVTDPTGVGRGKLLRVADLAKMYQEGRPLPCSIMSLDITGEDVEETGLVWAQPFGSAASDNIGFMRTAVHWSMPALVYSFCES